MIPLSVLDLSPIPEGSDATQSLRNTLDLARHAERLGYLRYWLAEHHNMRGIASAATSVVIAHVAAGTSTIRVGAGGVMLPNHAPLIIAEHYGTLAALHPGRIDLGLGRAPGTDMATARALQAQPRGRRRQLPAGRGRAARLFRAAIGERARSRSARRGPGREGLDPRIEHLRCAARGDARAALRFRLAFRAGGSGACARHLPVALPAVAISRQALCDARHQRLRRAERRRGEAVVQLAAAGVRQPAQRTAGAIAAARRGLRGDARSGGEGRCCRRRCRRRWSARPKR